MCLMVKGAWADDESSSPELFNTGIATGTENRCALRDQYGFLWVGTTTGLDCYDGNGISVYRNNFATLRTISNLLVSTLSENGEDIWIGGDTGLYIFDRRNNTVNQFVHRTKYGVKISSLVEKIVNVGQGRTWICTQGQGFFIFNKADSSLVQNSRYGAIYSDMVIGADGMVYLAANNGRIQVFRPDGQFMRSLRLSAYVADKNKIAMVASNRDIWISSGTCLYRLDIDSMNIVKVLTNGAGGTINALIARPDGTLLLGSNNGLWSYNTKSGNNQCISDTDINNRSEFSVKSLAVDANGDVIVIHPTGALDMMTDRSSAFKFVPISSGGATLNHNLIYAMALDAGENGLWIGSDRGVVYYDLKHDVYEKRMNGIGTCVVTSFTSDENNLWIGTQQNGLVLYDSRNGTEKHFVYDENIPYTVISNRINKVYRTRRGEIFILTDWGLCHFDSVSGNFPPQTDFGQGICGIDMQEDRYGGVWVATANDGLYYRKPDGTRFDRAGWCKAIGVQLVTMLHMDSKGRLWAATRNDGLYVYDDASNDFLPFRLSLLNGKNICFMAEDNSGSMWVGLNDVLLKISGDDEIHSYDFSWLDERMPVAKSVVTRSDGVIIIGCRNGLLFFDPSKINFYEEQVRVYPSLLTFPFLADDSDELSQLGLDGLLYMKKSVELPYDDNTFTIRLSAVRPSTQPNVRYDYMLRGVDKSWVMGAETPEVTYNNLPPGDYDFLLRPHGIKDAQVCTLGITILPPWYLSKWAFIIYFFLLLLVGYVVFLCVRMILRRNYQRRLHDLRIQKEREVFEAKTRFFVDLVHEIRTPLMLISVPLEQLAEENVTSTPTAATNRPRYIKSMQQNIDYLLGITNQLLDFRRAENFNEIQLSLSRCNFNEILTGIYRRFEEPLSINGKQIDLKLPNHDVFVVMDADKTERLLMNLIGNAMKYASHRIEIVLDETSEDGVSITVADDGPGVPLEERDRIFDAYYQIGNDNVATSLGTGLGLAYAKLIAVAHHGDIRVTDNPGGGALFVITLPKGADADIPVNPLLNDNVADCEPLSEIPVCGDKTVLVVEDNKELRDMITETLGHYYTVIVAPDGLLAIDILASNDVDVIVSDVMMPRMDGMELCRHVKGDINYSHIPFIILTAKTGIDAHEEGMNCGADMYLEKPFPIRQLVSQIGNLLRTRQLFYEHMRRELGLPDLVGSNTGTSLQVFNRMDAQFLEKMNNIISESVANEEFSIDLLAEKLNMSRSSFYRKVTAIIGMSPSDYLRTFRLNYAASLLRDGYRVTEVAERVGFTSSSYFAKCFRDKFGVLPSGYVASLGSVGESENGK